jgi:ketosteroid isomerase-like protein
MRPLGANIPLERPKLLQPDLIMPDFLPEDPNAATRSLIWELIKRRESPELFIQLFHEDAVVHVVGSRQDQPIYGSHRGHAQILQAMRAVDSTVELLRRKILAVVVDGDSFATRRLAEMRHRGTSVVVVFMESSIVRMRQGRIAEVFEYVDTAAVQLFDGDHD